MTEPRPDLLEEVQHLITALESHPDARVREQVTALLERIDLIHRTALTHLVEGIRGMAGEAFITRLTADPAVRLLLMSYDLVAMDRRVLAEEALDAVRGRLHARGIDMELLDLVGGVAYLRLHGLERSGVSPEAVRRDLEAALRAGLPGFQELVLGDRHAGRPAELVPLGGLHRPRQPIYRDALPLEALGPGTLRAVDLAGRPILLANVSGELYAVSNRCGDSPLPLEFGTLSGAELRCSWHGCRYDLRTGRRTDGGPERLAVFPVRVEDGVIKVAVGVEPVGAA